MQSIKRALIIACTTAAFTPAAHADPINLFSSISYSGSGNSPPPIDSLAVYDSTLDVAGLAAMPSQIAISIPQKGSEVSATIEIEQMDKRDGFTERDPKACNQGTTSACEEIPIPGWPANKFSYTLMGRGEGYELRVTVHHGNAVGVFSGPKGRFAISWQSLKELRGDYFRTDDTPPTNEQIVVLPQQGLSDTYSVPHLSAASINAATIARIEPSSVNSMRSTPTELDMLVLVTEAARVQAGGNPSDCRDTAGVLTYIYHNIFSMNKAFSDSLIFGKIGAVTVARLNGFTLVPYGGIPTNITLNRTLLQGNANIKAFRDQVGADVVSTLVDTQANLGVCGTAYIQRPNCGGSAPSCGSGALFSDYTHLVETIECSVADTFTHELGHVLGAEHDRLHSNASNSTASFPYAFGYSFGTTSAPGFETIMSQRFNTSLFPNRLPQFSNPDVPYNGVPTGTMTGPNPSNNALVLNNLLPNTASFRSRSSVDNIFTNGFDGMTACAGVNY